MSRLVVSLMLVGLATLTGCGWRRPTLAAIEAPITVAPPVKAPEFLPGTKVSRQVALPPVYAVDEPAPKMGRPVPPVNAAEEPTPTRPRPQAPPQTQTIHIAQDLPSVPNVPWGKDVAKAVTAQKKEDKAAVLASMNAKPAFKPARTLENDNDIVGALHHSATHDAKPKTPAVRPVSAELCQELTGHLTQFRKTWRLRYAAVNVEDAHGGSVTLDSVPTASKLRDGQHVRVRGRLLAPESRNESARFIVQSIELLD